MMGGWKLAFGLVAALAWATAPAGAEPKKDTLSVDLPADAATLDRAFADEPDIEDLYPLSPVQEEGWGPAGGGALR